MGTAILAMLSANTIAATPPYVIMLAAAIANLRSFNRIGTSTTTLPLVCPIQSRVGFLILGIRSKSLLLEYENYLIVRPDSAIQLRVPR